MSHANRTLRARYVFPGVEPPIPGGYVTICEERIVGIHRRPPGKIIEDLGDVAILPGLVNTHTHLELSDIPQPLGQPGMSLVDWIGLVIAHRRDRPTSQDALTSGIQESLKEGTTLLGDIAQSDWTIGQSEATRPELVVFMELIGPTDERIDVARHLATEHLGQSSLAAGWYPGLGPHAPYTVHPELLANVVRWSTAREIPVAFHLAESREEIQLLRDGSGPLRERLEAMGAWQDGAIAPGTRSADYLRMLGEAHRSLVIHGNYLDDDEIDLAAKMADRMSIVYCPRTHAYFEHPPYPLERMLRAGARVALGTDSRASSPDLNLLAEMRYVARRFPQVPGDTVLQLGTLNGAIALGRDRETGTLEPGKRADLAVVRLPSCESNDPHRLLFNYDEPVVAVYRAGQPADR